MSLTHGVEGIPEAARVGARRPPSMPFAALRRAARAAAAHIANRIDPPVLILAYHRVARLDTDPQRLAVTPERFARQLEVLEERFPVFRFAGDWNVARRPGVVLTFDDGYADNLHQALPALERLGLPATFFVTTGPVETQREFWWDELERHLLGPGPRPAKLDLTLGGAHGPASASGPEQRPGLYAASHARLKWLDPEAREAWLAALRDWSGEDAAPRASHRPLTVDEVRRLAASPLATVGAHGVTHTALAALSVERQRAEITGARSALEGWLGRPVTVASFPFGGRGDFDRDSLRLTRAAGFTRNAANLPRCCHRWSDPFRLPRHLVRDWDREEFGRRLDAFLRT